MYNNIVHEEGIKATRDYLDKHSKNGVTPFNASILDLLEHVFEMNNFQFNGDNYLQRSGTAMGTKYAPSYANIFMSDFEEKYIYTFPNFKGVLWLRFLDDIFCLWSGDDESIDTFVTYMNSIHDRI